MTRPLRRAAVLGAGVMGAQLAALLANAGVRVELLDLPGDGPELDRLAEEALKRLTTMKPPPLASKEALARIRPGNFADHWQRVLECDWILEAVVERPEPKRALYARLDGHLPEGTIVSSNTSGLSLTFLAQGLSPSFRRSFLGTHFFNPPRYMHLLELIPTAETSPEVVAAARSWGERILGKGVVVARDTPNFIANRIGVFALLRTVEAMERFGLAPETVDALTGPVIGRPRSATFRTLDIVGLDTLLHVADNMRVQLSDPSERELFHVPALLRRMAELGWLGEKAGQGFYQRRKEDGNETTLVLDPKTFTYHPPHPQRPPSLVAAERAPSLLERVRTLTFADDVGGQFTWSVTKSVLLYAARTVEEIAGGDREAVDRALRWGFRWELGPFELWAGLGLDTVARRMAQEGDALPLWLEELLDRHEERFYTPVPSPWPSVRQLRAHRKVVWENPGASLVDAGDDVVVLDLHPQKDAIGPDVIEALWRAAQTTELSYRGLVILNETSGNFCVGANLALLLLAAERGDWAAIEASVRSFQEANVRLKYLARPVVAAPWGLALGGGAELCLHASRIQAGSELYIGQVEAGAGLVPAGGGTKELLSRWLCRLPGDASWTPRQSGPAGFTFFDPAPFVLRAFEAIATAKVSGSAQEARSLGFLSAADAITANRDHLLADALAVVLHLDRLGYRPPDPLALPAPGREVRALLSAAIRHEQRSGRVSAHDALVAEETARVLTGGDVAQGTTLTEEHFLDLEREAFLRLIGTERTRERMRHLLATGRPLRN